MKRENQPTLLSRYNFWQALHQKKGRREERERHRRREGERVRGDQGQKRCTTEAPLPPLPFFFSPAIRHSTNPNRYRTHATAAAAAAWLSPFVHCLYTFLELSPSLSLYSLASSGGGERAASLGHSDCLGRPRYSLHLVLLCSACEDRGEDHKCTERRPFEGLAVGNVGWRECHEPPLRNIMT